MSWPEELADALDEQALAPEEIVLLLDVARDVAHNTERRYAPVSTYLLGLAVGAAGATQDGGGDRMERLAALVRQTRQLLGVEDAGS